MSTTPARSTEITPNGGVLSPPSKGATAQRNLLPKSSEASRERSKIREIISVLKLGPLARLVYRKRQLSKPQETNSLEPVDRQSGGIPSPRAKRETLANPSSTAVNAAWSEGGLVGEPDAGRVIDHPNFPDIDSSDRYELDGMFYTLLYLSISL